MSRVPRGISLFSFSAFSQNPCSSVQSLAGRISLKREKTAVVKNSRFQLFPQNPIKPNKGQSRSIKPNQAFERKIYARCPGQIQKAMVEKRHPEPPETAKNPEMTIMTHKASKTSRFAPSWRVVARRSPPLLCVFALMPSAPVVGTSRCDVPARAAAGGTIALPKIPVGETLKMAHHPSAFRATIMITEESFIDFECPYCGGAVSFLQDTGGFAQQCPNCMESLIVPEAAGEPGRKIPVPITTSRLILRRFAAGDWKDLMELLADEDFFQYMYGLTGAEEEQVLDWLERDSQIKLTTPNQPFRLAIQLQDGGKLIGCLTLWLSDQKPHQATFHIFLHRNHQRKGFAVEAVDALLGFCFEGIKLHRVTASCFSSNTTACRMLENVGMRREGEFVKDQRLLDGTWVNTVWYAALEEEYRDAAAKPEAST